MELLRKIARSQEQLVAVYISPSTMGISVVDEGNGVPKVSCYDFATIEQDEFGGRSYMAEPEHAAETIRVLLKRNGVRRRDASISIPTHDVIIRTVEMPILSDEEFLAAAEIGGLWDAFSWVPQGEEYFIDFMAYNRNDSTGMMSACMVAAPLTVVDQYRSILELAGLNTVMIDTHNFAAWRALNRWLNNEKEQYSAICEIVSSGDYVTVLREGIPELTELYGNDQLRQQFIAGEPMQVDEQAQLFDSYAAQIGDSLQLERNDFVAGQEEEAADEERATVVVLTNIHAVQQSKQKMVQEMERHRLSLGSLHKIFNRPKTVEREFREQGDQAALLITLGLGLRRLELFGDSSDTLWGARSINLLPGYRVLKKNRKRRFLLNFWSALIGIPLMAMLVFVYMMLSQNHHNLSVEVVEYDRLTRSITHLTTELEEKGVKLKNIKEFIEVSEHAGNNYRQTYTLLQDLVNKIPLAVRLDAIEWREEGILLVRGVAESDSEILSLIESLRQSGLYQRVSLTMIAQESKGAKVVPDRAKGERGFVIECAVRPTNSNGGDNGN